MADIVLNFNSLKDISIKIKKLTHSGFYRIDPSQIRDIVDICKISDKYVEHVFSRIFISLKENHSEVRLASVILCDHFFNYFASFRSLLISNFETYFKLTFGEKFKKNLPPPADAAETILKTVIKNLKDWFFKYGKDYPKLVSAYDELRNEKFVDFESLEIYNPVERAKKEKEAVESLRIAKSLLEKACNEFMEMEYDMNNSLASLQSCFEILFGFPDEKTYSSNITNDDLRLHGMLKSQQSIDIELNLEDGIKIKVNDENSAVVDNAKDMFNLINKKYLPKVKALSVLVSKVGNNEELSEKVLLIENRLVNAVVKFKNISFIYCTKDDYDSVSTDSELEEVEEEAIVKNKPKIEEENDLFKENPERNIEKPCCSKSTDSFSDRKKELLKIAPKIPYSSDLYHWEDGNVATETLLPTATDGHRFWASSSVESIEVPAESANLRVIEYAGKFEPVTRACKAPLPSGKLCPRRDRVKCPFHGIIVPRDETGKIINEEDEAKVKKSKPVEVVPDWQDPKLLSELKAATGLDLKIGRKKAKKKHPGLTDIKKKKCSIDNISKKIFKSSTMKRVNKTLDKLDYRRHRDKYGDQFNYVHNT